MTNPAGRQYEGFTYPTESDAYTYRQDTASSANPLSQGFGLAGRSAASGLIRRTTPQPPATATGGFGGSGGYNYFHQHTNSTGGHSAFGSESGSVTSSRAAAAAASNAAGSGPALVSVHNTGTHDPPSRGAGAGPGAYRAGAASVSSNGSQRAPGLFVQASPTSADVQFMNFHEAPPAAVGVAAQPQGPFYASTGTDTSPSPFQLDANANRDQGAFSYATASSGTGHQRQPFVQPPRGGNDAWAGGAQGDSTQCAASSGGLFARLFGSMLNDYDGPDGGVPRTGDAPRPVYQTRFGYPEDDLPLLDELGINPMSIFREARVVLNPLGSAKVDPKDVTDLAGPLVFVVALAFLLSLHKKELQFNAIYSLCVAGLLFFKGLLSLMSAKGVSIIFVMSALGYSLLPNLFLAVVRVLLRHPTALLACGAVVALWSSWCATVLLVKGLEMERQRYLILYPVFLFYAVFATLTIF